MLRTFWGQILGQGCKLKVRSLVVRIVVLNLFSDLSVRQLDSVTKRNQCVFGSESVPSKNRLENPC